MTITQILIKMMIIVGMFVVSIEGDNWPGWNYPSIGCTPPNQGLNATLPLCTATDPCTQVLSSYPPLGYNNITIEDFVPSVIKTCRNGTMSSLKVSGIHNRTRYYCAYFPPGNSGIPVPLVLYFAGSGGTVNTVFTATTLAVRAQNSVIKPGVTGFALVSISPLNRHWPQSISGIPPGTQDGAKNNYLYLNFEDNEDYIFVDQLINDLVTSGKIDPKYIFCTGHSNGAQFATQYSFVRGAQASPYGHQVASAAVYSGSNPFADSAGDNTCSLANYPQLSTHTVPLLIISRDCDIVPCAAVKAAITVTFPQKTGNAVQSHIILDENGTQVYVCQDSASWCTATLKSSNHGNWPNEWEPTFIQWWINATTSTSTTSATSAASTSTSTSASSTSTTSATSAASTSTSASSTSTSATPTPSGTPSPTPSNTLTPSPITTPTPSTAYATSLVCSVLLLSLSLVLW